MDDPELVLAMRYNDTALVEDMRIKEGPFVKHEDRTEFPAVPLETDYANGYLVPLAEPLNES